MTLTRNIVNPALSANLGSNASVGTLETFITVVIGVITIAAGLYFIFQIFSGAFQWLTGGGDKQSLEAAQKRLTHAVVGLLLVVLSYAIVALFGYLFGFDPLDAIDILNTLRL